MGLKPNLELRKLRRQQVLRAIMRLTEALGYPPSYRDLGVAMGLAHSAVFNLVEMLRTEGLIHEREAKHSRAIRLTDAGRVAALDEGYAPQYPGS